MSSPILPMVGDGKTGVSTESSRQLQTSLEEVLRVTA